MFTAEARANTDDALWRSAEWVPIIGPNMAAVRVASTAADELVNGAVIPATDISIDALKPQGGAIDVAAVQELADKVEHASSTIDQVAAELDGLDRDALIGPVESGINQLDEAVSKLKPTLDAADTTLKVLPAALGADGPRNYLMLFQNNAESRGTGGNPAAIVTINVTDGKITITQQANERRLRQQPAVADHRARPRDRCALRRQDRALHARHHAHPRLHRERRAHAGPGPNRSARPSTACSRSTRSPSATCSAPPAR